MKLNAEILNIVFYTSKKGKPCTWIKYRLLGEDYLVNSDKMIGYSILEETIYNQNIKGKITAKDMGVQAVIEIEEVQGRSNPLNLRRLLKSIKVGNNVVYLV